MSEFAHLIVPDRIQLAMNYNVFERNLNRCQLIKWRTKHNSKMPHSAQISEANIFIKVISKRKKTSNLSWFWAMFALRRASFKFGILYNRKSSENINIPYAYVPNIWTMPFSRKSCFLRRDLEKSDCYQCNECCNNFARVLFKMRRKNGRVEPFER